MKLDSLFEELGWAGDAGLRAALAPEWDTSQSCRPEHTIPFLSPRFATDVCRDLSLPASAGDALAAVADKVSADPALRALAWYFHYCAFRSNSYPAWGAIARWPTADALSGPLGQDGRTFYLLILLSGLPGMKAIYDSRGISPEVFKNTLIQLKGELAELHQTDNVWGLSGPDRVQWHRFALRGELFRLGRLSYQFGLFRWSVRVFRHRDSGEVAALSDGGVSFLPGGDANGPGRADSTDVWTSEFTATDGGVTGHPILPTGCALRRQVHLPAAQWQQVLARNDPALYMHIPGGSPLSHDSCGESIERAMEFFPQHFPDRPFVCFCCDSWVLNSELQELLPPTSNMVRFQRELHLLPHATHDEQLLAVAFGGIPEDLSTAPQDTALRRALLDYIATGRSLHGGAGAGFLLPSDFRWGQQVYLQERSDPWMTNAGQ